MDPSLRRADFLDQRELQGQAFCDAYTELIDDWLYGLFERAGGRDVPVALVALGGHGRRELAPQSDLDLLLLVGRGAPKAQVAHVADGLWYPIWDADLKLGHAVRSVRDTLALANGDLETATALLSARHLAGDGSLSADLAEKAKRSWRKRGRKWLAELADSVEARHRNAGDVAFDLEPDLKDGRGGLRDVHALRWAGAAGADIDDRVLADVQRRHDELLAVRVELHRAAAAAGDRLLLQEQDLVAAALGDGDADSLMAKVASAGRSIAWTTDEVWYDLTLTLPGRRRNRFDTERMLEHGLVLRHGRVCLADESAPPRDPTAVLRVARAAARCGARIGADTLDALRSAPPLPMPWPPEATTWFVDVLRNGPASVPVIESLDQAGLWQSLLPEWEPLRSLPQRNVLHRYTVDRHLLECSAEAASLAHRTPRPDLLVLGALLHDIGKGRPGDHSETGARLAEGIVERMGLCDADVDTVVFLVRHHLLLAEVATRRDLEDPATIEGVAETVGSPDRLALLRALTEADGLATGPSAWTSWKAQLVDQLAGRVASIDAGVVAAAPEESRAFPDSQQRALMRAGATRAVLDGERITIVCPDRPGVFSRAAGALALHGLDVVEANAYSDGEMALDEFRVVVGGSGVLPWDEVRADVVRSLEGRLAVQARLDERARNTRRHRRAPSQFPASVRFDNEATPDATVLEATGPDRVGLLYALARTLSELGLNVTSAKIHTMGADVVDSFYVTLADGSKVLDDDHRSEIRRALLHVLELHG